MGGSADVVVWGQSPLTRASAPTRRATRDDVRRAHAFHLESLEPRRLFSLGVVELSEAVRPWDTATYTVPITSVPVDDLIIVNPAPPTKQVFDGPAALPNLYNYLSVADAGAGRLVGGGGTSDGQGTVLFRLRRDGSFDPAFGGGDGIVKIAGSGMLTQLIVQDDGKLLLLTGTWDAYDGWSVYRLNADGSADRDFGTGGRLDLPRTWTADGDFPTIAVRPDGGFVAANVVTDHDDWERDRLGLDPLSTLDVAVYTPAGRRDRSFGVEGRHKFVAPHTLSEIVTVDVSPSGAIDLQVPAWGTNDAYHVRYASGDPSAAPTFAVLPKDPDNRWDDGINYNPTAPDGRTASVVYRHSTLGEPEIRWGESDSGQAVVRVYDPDGTPDASFGDRGRAAVPNDPRADAGWGDVAFTDDGGVVEWHAAVKNHVEYSVPLAFTITRFTPDGRLDPEFGGGDGQVILPFDLDNGDVSDEADWHINLPTETDPDDLDPPVDEPETDSEFADDGASYEANDEYDWFDEDDEGDVYDDGTEQDDALAFGADEDELWDA